MATEYIKKSTLSWPDLWRALGMVKDSASRWTSSPGTPDYVREYIKGYRTPSRAHPNSYATALMSQKFAKHLTEKDPVLAVTLGVAQESM